MAYINEPSAPQRERGPHPGCLTRVLLVAIALTSLLIIVFWIRPLPAMRDGLQAGMRQLRGLFAASGEKPDEIAEARRAPALLNPDPQSTRRMPSASLVTEPPVTEPPPYLSAEEVDARKARMGEFFVPLPDNRRRQKTETVVVKGLYVSHILLGSRFSEEAIDRYVAYIEARRAGQAATEPEVDGLNRALALCRATEVNALIIDIKGDYGNVTWPSEIEAVQSLGSDRNNNFVSWREILDYADKHDIYTIARVVTFKDPHVARSLPDHAIQLKAGGVYVDPNKEHWVNPFDPFIWNYTIGVAQEAALRGFDEVNFDYIRFPENSAHYNPITHFPYRDDRDKAVAINEFLDRARQELDDYGVHVSADVFGITTHTWNSQPEDIGQIWRDIANRVEAICPMIYPSHYGRDWYGFEFPDAAPYGVVLGAMREAIERNAAQATPGVIRPWLQAFTASWVRGHIEYTPEVIAEQIRGARELGCDEYLLWQARGDYPLEIFLASEAIPLVPADAPRERDGQRVDLLDRTAVEALSRYLSAFSNKQYSRVYLLTPLAERPTNYDEFLAPLEAADLHLKGSAMLTVNVDQETGELVVDVQLSFASGELVRPLQAVPVRIILENGVYKVSLPPKALERVLDNRPIVEPEQQQGAVQEPTPSTTAAELEIIG